MTLTSMPVSELIAAFRAPAPTPGGGSAAALAGAVGAALLAMVAGLPKHRAASEEDVDRLQAAAMRCGQISDMLTGLVDRDSAAYEAVVAAWHLPKGSDEEQALRKTRVQGAMIGAAEMPLEVMRHCAEALEAATVVARFGNPHASSDAGVALELLTAAHRGARLNVEINLAGIEDAAYTAGVVGDLERLDAQCTATAARAAALLRDAATA